MPWGRLTALVSFMHPNDRRIIASRMGFRTQSGMGDEAAFISTLEFLRYTRNLCAHHSRVYNRSFDRTPSIPSAKAVPELAHLVLRNRVPNRAYDAVMIVRYLLPFCAATEKVREFNSKALQLLSKAAEIPGVLEDLGAPEMWNTADIWTFGTSSKPQDCVLIDTILASDCLNRRQVLSLITSRESEADCKKWVRYLVKRNALIHFSHGETQYYPRFQFRDGDVNPCVADINVTLLSDLDRQGLTENERSIAAMKWWERMRNKRLNLCQHGRLELTTTNRYSG